MFQFPALHYLTVYIAFNYVGSPIRTSMGHRSFASTHSFSQLITSFVSSESLGIPHTLLFDFSLYLCFFIFFFLYVNELFKRPKAFWWRMTESNRRPPACKAGALAS